MKAPVLVLSLLLLVPPVARPQVGAPALAGGAPAMRATGGASLRGAPPVGLPAGSTVRDGTGLGDPASRLIPRGVTGVARAVADETAAAALELARAPSAQARRRDIERLLQAYGDVLDLDPAGEPVLRAQFLALEPDDADLAAIGREGFAVRREPSRSDALGLRIVVIEDMRRRGARASIQALQRIAPRIEFAYEHVYLPSGGAAGVSPRSAEHDRVALKAGLVDGGVDASLASFAGVRVHRHGCGGRSVVDAHGTTVALRLIGGGRGDLYAADVRCGAGPGRGTLALVEALAWMADEGVPVVNISLVGPHNPVLARAVQAMHARGHVLVAAVGNDGPAAPPLYPAAYPGVVGVAAVDERTRLLPESGSGAHVDFVAPGVVRGGRPPVRGTSFAAPLVARMAAALVRAPSPGAGERVLQALGKRARDLGDPGRDPRYGEGLVATRP